jgi:Protein of unknown function (DUF1573)
MRVWIIIAGSVVIGLALGLGSTMFEFGMVPDGSGEIELGPKHPKLPPPPASGPPPKVAIEGSDEFNFGRLEKDVEHRHVFVIRNVGKGPLTLEKGQTSCSCTVSEIERTEVPPGESTKVTVQWKAKKQGPFRQSAQVLTNDPDPDHQTLDLIVSGEIVSSYRMDQGQIVFTNVTATKGASGSARIFSFETDDLDVLRPEFVTNTIAKFFDLKVEKMTAEQLKDEAGAKSGVILRVTVKPGLPAGPIAQKINFHLNLPGEPEVELPIEGRVSAPIEVISPLWDSELGVLKLGRIRPSEGGKFELYLLVRDEAQAKAQIAIADCPPPLKLIVGQPEKLDAAATKVPLTLELPRGTRPVDHWGTQDGKLARILLDTGLADTKQLQILVQYIVVED